MLSGQLTAGAGALLLISGFVFDEMFQRNASKFAMFYKKVILSGFFLFKLFDFVLPNELVYVVIDQSI